jgi:putative ABC transport system ATP-binding protein
MSKRRPSELSGGQQQRVAVARAMVSNPDIILADEPTANLDSHSAIDLLDMMRRLNEEKGMTFVFSTHDSRIMERAKRLIMLKDGMIDSEEIR